MPKQDGNIKIVESFITSNKPMSLNNKNIYYNEYSDEVLIRYYQTLIAVRKDKSVRILEGINKYSASTNVLVRLIERIAKEKGCTVTYVKQFAKGSTVKGGITIHELENRLSEHTQVIDDKTLDSEEIHNWGADNVTEYKKAQNEIDKIKYKGKGWEIYGWYDVSSFDYWIIKQEEQNYIQITIKFKNETVKEEEVDEIADALDSALADADRITNKYNYNPSKFAKGSTIKGDGGAHSYKIKYWETDEDMDRGESEIYDYYSNKEEAIDRAEKYQSKFSWFAVEVSDEKDNVVYENNFGEYAKGSTVKGGKIKTFDDAKTYFLKNNIKITKAYNPKYWIMHDYLFEGSGLMVTKSDLIGYANKGLYAKGSTVKGGGVGDTIADRYARLTKTEAKRLDELSKKVRINEQTDEEDIEWDKLVHKYRGWDYKGYGKYAKGSTLKNANSESEKFELKVLQALSGYNNGREENGIMEGLGLSNYRFNQYASKQEVAKVEKTLKSLIKNKYIEEGGIGYKITQIGANHLRSFNYGSYGNGGGVAVSSESGLAVGTNADLMMNQNNLQYADGGGVGEKKYLFVSYNVTVNEDSFEEGESIENFSEYDEKVGKVYNSMENLLKDMNRIMGTEYSKDDFDFETGEGRNIQTDVLVDEDFIPPYANEVEKWKKGELKLYNAHYSFYVMPIYVADQYANGGNMSMGFNYEIGGL
jgi:hypothetical protein